MSTTDTDLSMLSIETALAPSDLATVDAGNPRPARRVRAR